MNTKRVRALAPIPHDTLPSPSPSIRFPVLFARLVGIKLAPGFNPSSKCFLI